MGIRMLAEKTGEILVKSVFSLIALHQYSFLVLINVLG